MSPDRVSTTMNDAELLERFSRGQSDAFTLLFERYRDPAFRVAWRLLGNVEDALDAVQNGFIKALNHLDRLESRESFKTWLLRIISNAALDLGRQRQRRLDLKAAAELLAERRGERNRVDVDPVLQAEEHDLRQAVRVALSLLPEEQRQVFVLHAEGGLSYREIAEIMQTSMGTVMSRLFYARQKLQGILANKILVNG